MITRIEPALEPYILSLKRCYLPFTVHAVCPHCGATATRNLGTDCLDYPRVGLPERVVFTHTVANFEEPDHEWVEHIMLTITVGVAP